MTRLQPAVAGPRHNRRELTQKTGNKIIEPFCFFRVFRGQKRFIYPRNTLKDAKISKRKIGWFMFLRHDQAFDTNTSTTSARRSQWRTLTLGGLDTTAPCSTPGTSVQSVLSVVAWPVTRRGS
jgi:hypothetical protein